MITAKTKMLCVIGDPIKHSLSPQIHNEFISQSKLDYVYTAFEINKENLSGFVDASRYLDIAGYNVTMPNKQEIIKYIDEISEQAKPFGAINTVVNSNGRLVGYNTDGDGFIMSLELNDIDIGSLKKIVILGAGGAARTIAISLIQKGIEVILASRKMEDINVTGLKYCYFDESNYDELNKNIEHCDLLINATPLGMHGFSQDFTSFDFLHNLHKNAIVYDFIYSPAITNLLFYSKKNGLKSINGLSYLICQAALSYNYFTGYMPNKDLIFKIRNFLL